MNETKFTGIILLEGPDAAGKTTLAEAIKKVAGPTTEIIHLTWSPKLETVMSQYNAGVLAHADELAKDRLVILDRQCLSSYVYQSTFRSEQAHHHQGMYSHFQHYCPNASIVFCLPDFTTWKQNFLDMCASREEMYGADKVDQMVEVYNRYKSMATGSTHETIDWYPDNLLMDHMLAGGVIENTPNSTTYDFTKLVDDSAEMFATGFLMAHQNKQ